MLKLIGLIILLSGAAYAQTAPQQDPFPGWVDPQSQTEVRREASVRLEKREKIDLVKYKDGGLVLISIYPQRREIQTYRGIKECFSGTMPIHDMYINSEGYLTVITRARTPGCNDSLINIDPIEGIAGEFAYNIETREQSKSSFRLYLKKD